MKHPALHGVAEGQSKMQEFTDSSELKNFVSRAIANERLLDRVRKLLGRAALTDARVRQWRQGKDKKGEQRGVPELLQIGAALRDCATSEELDPDAPMSAPSSVPPALLREHRDAVIRTKLWGRAAWHVFEVLPKPARGAKKLDVKVWRFWEGVRTVERTQRSFAHTSLIEGAVADQGWKSWTNTEHDGESNKSSKSAVKEGEERLDVTADGKVTAVRYLKDLSSPDTNVDVSHDFLYWFNACHAIQQFEGEGQTHEFLGGINSIPVEKSYCLLSIPANLLDQPWVGLLVFVPLISPVTFINTLVRHAGLKHLTNRSHPLHKALQPWGELSQAAFNGSTNVPIPARLAEHLSPYFVESFRGRIPDGFSTAFSESLLPPPLVYHTLVWKLSAEGK